MYNYVEWNRSVGQVYVFNGAGRWHICMCWMEQVSGAGVCVEWSRSEGQECVLNGAGQRGRSVC